MTQKIKTILLAIMALAIFGAIVPAKNALAADTVCPPTEVVCPNPSPTPPPAAGVKTAENCPSGKVDASDDTKCAPLGNGCNGNSAATCLQNNSIIKAINYTINFLSAGVGIVVVGMIILGGIQYTVAGDNPTAVTAARKRITNALIALAAFLLTFAFLQWIVPGGL